MRKGNILTHFYFGYTTLPSWTTGFKNIKLLSLNDSHTVNTGKMLIIIEVVLTGTWQFVNIVHSLLCSF